MLEMHGAASEVPRDKFVKNMVLASPSIGRPRRSGNWNPVFRQTVTLDAPM